MTARIEDKSNHIIDRSSDCNIIPNATDKPIELWMHHFHARSLIINLKTGDVLSYLFSPSSWASAQQRYFNDATAVLEHTIFLELEGEKALFILETNYNPPVVQDYIKAMEKAGAKYHQTMIADVKNDCPDYEQYQYGEIATGFIFDLNDLSKINVSFGDDPFPFLSVPDMTVGTEPTTLPDVQAYVQEYFKYVNIGKMIAWADERLPEQLEKSGIDLSTLSELTGHIATAISTTMEKEHPFRSEHLYKDEFINHVPDTLSFVKEKGLDTLVVANLTGIAIGRLSNVLYDEESAVPEFFCRVELAKKLTNFAYNLYQDAETDEDRNNLDMQMQQQLFRLNRTLLSVLDEATERPTGIEEVKTMLLELIP